MLKHMNKHYIHRELTVLLAFSIRDLQLLIYYRNPSLDLPYIPHFFFNDNLLWSCQTQ